MILTFSMGYPSTKLGRTTVSKFIFPLSLFCNVSHSIIDNKAFGIIFYVHMDQLVDEWL